MRRVFLLTFIVAALIACSRMITGAAPLFAPRTESPCAPTANMCAASVVSMAPMDCMAPRTQAAAECLLDRSAPLTGFVLALAALVSFALAALNDDRLRGAVFSGSIGIFLRHSLLSRVVIRQ